MAEEKIGLIEYRLFELCKNVLDGYQKKLEGYEREVDNLNVPVSWENYQIDRDCLHHSIMSLQLLLGFHCLPQMYSAPRTLEAALRDLGVNEGEIDFDIKSCESYLQRAA